MFRAEGVAPPHKPEMPMKPRLYPANFIGDGMLEMG